MIDRLALTGVIGFALGILLASLYVPALNIAGFLCLVGIAFLGTYIFLRHPLYLGTAVLVLAAALGTFRVALAPLTLPQEFVPLLSTETTLEGIVVAPPDIRETHQRITLEVEREGTKTRVLVVTDLYPSIRFGERVTVVGTFELPEPFETTSSHVFRYDRFLAKDGVFAVLSFAHIHGMLPRTGWYTKFMGFIADIKPTFIHALESALPEPMSSLAGGLIAGGKEGLGKVLEKAFITAGLIHIVVLSGYNVMIVARFIMSLFAFTSKRLQSLLAGFVVSLFVLAAGAGAASIRAGLMALVALYAHATTRVYEAVRALLFIGVMMLLWNPLLLAYDPGFELSFVATLGLIIGVPIVERWLAFVNVTFIREIMSATIAAQIAVLPLLLYQTGLLSLVSLPANLLVLPIVPLAMLFSFVAGVAGLVLPALGNVLGLPALALLWYIVAVTEFFAGLPIAAFTVPTFPFVVTVAAYALLGFCVWKYFPRKVLRPRTASRRRPS